MRFKALLVAGIFFASTSIALGGNIPAAWIGWKAEKIVTGTQPSSFRRRSGSHSRPSFR